MARTVGIGHQDFGKLIENNLFYVDKTKFIKEWWESGDEVTLITRPRRFGKTLTMSMAEYFFSVQNSDKAYLFEGLSVWEYEKYRALQGTYPVVNLSFANVKATDYETARKDVCQILTDIYNDYTFLLDKDILMEEEWKSYKKVSVDMDDTTAAFALQHLSKYLYRKYNKKVLILLDEYDTPMQEAYVGGYWEEMAAFFRRIFNSTFKTNPYMERAIITGITRISRESMFSDLNNLKVVTATSNMYADVFGFTEREVFDAMDEMGLTNKKSVKDWYDGFIFGNVKDIYNPWSIICFLKEGKVGPYWVNTSSNGMAGKLLQEADAEMKMQFEELLHGKSISCIIDEEIVFNRLESDRNAIWSLFLASGYLKILTCEQYLDDEVENGMIKYELILTNTEVSVMFKKMVSDWFKKYSISAYNDFVKALLLGDVKAMNRYMNRVAMNIFSFFDTGKKPSESEPERFYHGFVLGLMVELGGRYEIRSNRESGFGRYDIMLEPENKDDNGIIIEFKVYDPDDEQDLKATVSAALEQIEEKEYEQELISRGIREERIRKYGFAFEGKEVLIGGGLQHGCKE